MLMTLAGEGTLAHALCNVAMCVRTDQDAKTRALKKKAATNKREHMIIGITATVDNACIETFA